MRRLGEFQLRVELFGHFSVTCAGAPLTTLRTARLQALFAYLILNRSTSLLRSHLAYQFWPDTSEAQARTNLRNLVHLLRQAWPDFDRFIQTDAQTLQWRETALFSLDVLEFEQRLASTPGSGPTREQLDATVALYHGDLLPSCYDEWILPERARLRRAYLAALEALAAIAESSREYAGALEYARRLLQDEPLHATANRQLIRLLTLLDDRPAALTAYRTYSGLLQRELGLQPDPDTQALYANLKAQSQRDSDRAARPGQAPLVGRRAEWRKLLAVWREAAAGRPQALFVTGEAGIGKTRFVEELVGWASRQGLRAAVARCYPAEGSLPYAPVVSWLRTHPLPPLDDIWLTELSRLLPEILQTRPKVAPPQPLTEAWQRQRLFEALARALLGNRSPLLLVVEDSHWCDQDTLEWLHFLLRFDPQAPILVVATERSEAALAPDHPLRKLKTALTQADQYDRIEMTPLNEADSFQLATHVAAHGPRPELSPELSARIFAETEGNPLFVVELVRLGAPWPAPDQPAGAGVPLSDKVRQTLNGRIDQLSAPTRELASLAAAIGREFRPDVLQQAGGVADEALVKGLNELLRQHIVAEQTPDRYDFTHDKLRQALLTGLSTAHRRLLHRRVAEAYLHLGGETPQLGSAEIASHYEQAGLALPAIRYYRQASEAAAQIFSQAEAIRWLRAAIALAESLPHGSLEGQMPSQELALLYESLGTLLDLSGDYAAALEAFQHALAQPFAQPPIWQSVLYRKVSAVQNSLYRHDDAQAALEAGVQALGLGETAGSPEARHELINLLLARGQMSYWHVQWPEIERVLRQVEPEMDAYGTNDQRLELLKITLLYHFRRENYRLPQATVDIARRWRELCRAAGDPASLADSEFHYGFARLWQGEPGLAQADLSDALASAAAMGARTVQTRCVAYLSIASRQLKQVAAVRGQTEDLFTLATAVGEEAYVGVAWANRAWLAWQAGDAPLAIDHGQAALQAWAKFPTPYARYVFQWLALWPLLAVAVDQRRLGEAEKLAQDLLSPAQQPRLAPLPALLTEAIRACQSDDQDRASALFHQVLQTAQTLGDL
jgi:DNA-binding SARP family transcriptional activator